MGLGGLGYFAGGMASGLQQGSRMRRENEEERRREEEDKRAKNIRRAASNTLGNVGQQREDGSTYGEPDAYKDYASQVAQYDPAASMQARTQGLQLSGLQRQEAQQALQEQTLALMRQVQAGRNPVEVFREGAKLYAGIPDGKHASVSEDGQNLILTNAAEGTSKVVPASAEMVMKALQRMHDMSSPQAYQQGREHGLKERQVGASERTAGAAETTAGAASRNADSAAALVQPRSNLLNAQAGQARDHGAYFRGLSSPRNQERIVNFVDKKTGEVVPFRFNQHTGGFEKLTMPEDMSLGMPNQRGQLQALGNTGLLTDGAKAYRFDERANQLIEVPMPGRSILDRLGSAEEEEALDTGAPAWREIYQRENEGSQVQTPWQGLRQRALASQDESNRARGLVPEGAAFTGVGRPADYRRRAASRYTDIQ